MNDTDINQWDPDRFGSIIWDDDFDPTLFTSLEFLNNFCNDLIPLQPEFVPEGERKNIMSCWVIDFITYVEGTSTSWDPSNAAAGYSKTASTLQESTMPAVSKSLFYNLMEDFLKTEDGAQYTSNVGLRGEFKEGVD